MNFNIDTIIYTLIITTIVMVIYLYIELRKKPQKPEYDTKTLLKCPKCGYQIEKNYELGEFIGMIKGKCPKCNTPMKIIAIYAVEKTLKPRKT